MSAIEAVFYADDRSSQGQKTRLSALIFQKTAHTFIFGRDVTKTLPFYGTGR
jgi:hypothetical protein